MKNASQFVRYRCAAVGAVVLCLSALEPPAAPAASPAATKPSESSQITFVGRVEAANLPVDTSNWRTVLARLDTVYTVPAVADVRNRLLAPYLEAMTQSDTLATWPQREAARALACEHLATGLPDIEAIQRTASDDRMKNEAQILWIDVQEKLGHHEPAAEKAAALLTSLPPGALKSQVYYLLISADNALLRTDEAKRLQKDFRNAMPTAANDYYTSLAPFGRLRTAATLFGYAGQSDDMAMQLPENAAQSLKIRNGFLLAAQQALHMPNSAQRSATTSVSAPKTPPAHKSQLAAGYSLVRARVTAADGKAPIAGALLMIQNDSGKLVASNTTDVHGTLEPFSVPQGDYHVVAMLGTQPLAPLSDFHVPANGASPIDVEVKAFDGALQGSVIAVNGQPISGASVRLVTKHGTYSAKSDAQGAFVMNYVQPSDYMGYASATGYRISIEKQIVVKNAGEPSAARFILTPGVDR